MSCLGCALCLIIPVIIYAVQWIRKQNAALNYNDLRSKNIIITGASRGIECAKGGANLIITATDATDLQKVAEKCRRSGCQSVSTITMDLGDISNYRIFESECLKIFKDANIHYLFLNHVFISGYKEWINPKNLRDFDIVESVETINSIMTINTTAYIALATIFYPHLELHGGRLVISNSAAGYTFGSFVSVYGASKHALAGFFENWRTELSEYGSSMSITVCIISLVGTQSAISAVSGILPKSMVERAANPNDVAQRMISAAQQRLPYAYIPFVDIVMAMCLQRICPGLLRIINRYLNYRRFW